MSPIAHFLTQLRAVRIKVLGVDVTLLGGRTLGD